MARFILDVHLGTLARRLRLVGADVAYANDLDDALIEHANTGRRVLLTPEPRLAAPGSRRLAGLSPSSSRIVTIYAVPDGSPMGS
jgi:uncharacterized protein with PIN domain